MTLENKKLSEFTEEKVGQSGESSKSEKKSVDGENSSKSGGEQRGENTDLSTVCDCYYEMKNKHEHKLNELGIMPPKCGHCIDYVCTELSAGTARTYNSSLRMFIEYIHQNDICINNVEYIDVQNYFELRGKQKRSTSTIAKDRAAIKGVISRFEAINKDFPAVAWKISENIDPDNYGVGTVYERDPLNNKEIEELLTASGDLRDQLMMVTSVETGPRGEATCLIEVSDVDLEKKEIELQNTKSGGTYIVPLTDGLTALLRHWIREVRSSYVQDENNSYLFPSRRGGKMTEKSYCNIVNKAAKQAGIQEEIAKIPQTERQSECFDPDENYRSKKRVDVHTLRHTFSRLLKDSGISKNARRYALDHSPDVTDGYGVDEEACRDEIRNKFNGIDISAL